MDEVPPGRGLVELNGDRVSWCDEGGRSLVEPFGGSWTEPNGPVRVLVPVAAGSAGFTAAWLSPTGETRWWRITCTATDTGRRSFRIHDRTQEVEAYRHVHSTASDWRLDHVERLAGMGSWMLDLLDGRVEWSSNLLAMFDLPTEGSVGFDAFRDLLHPDDLARMDVVMAEGIASRSRFTFSHRVVVHGRERTLYSECEAFYDADGRPTEVLGISRDVTEEYRALGELAHQADHDPLTGVANRRKLTARLAELAACPAGVTLLLIDVDLFKEVNDRFGHTAGDDVLRVVAGTVSACLDEEALLGRLGGDEFAVLLPLRDPEAGLRLAQRVCAVVAGTPIHVAGTPVTFGVSIGVASMPSGVVELEVVLARADAALYEAKNGGRGRARLFTGEVLQSAGE